MPNTCFSFSLSLALFFFFFFLLFVFEKKIIELQHIVVFNLYKKQLLLFLEEKKKETRHLRNFLVPLGGVSRYTIYS